MALAGEAHEVEFTYASHGDNDRQARDHDGAKKVLVETGVRIKSYAAADPEMTLWADELEQSQVEYGLMMDSRRQKQEYNLSSRSDAQAPRWQRAAV